MTKRTAATENMEDAGFDLLWGQRAGFTRGPKPAFRLDEIVRVGIAVADRDGLSALTMAAVAKRLGVTTMALYRYVPTKNTLVDLVADRAMGRPPKPTGSSWRADVTTWARTNLALVRRHPWLFEVISTRPSVGPNWARWVDAGLQSLASLPFSPHENLAVLVLVDGHVRAAAQILVGAKASGEWTSNFSRMLRRVVDDPRYPALGTVVVTGGSDEGGLDLEGMIDFGFERLLDGIEALAKTRSRR